MTQHAQHITPGTNYTVQGGDSLWAIAERAYGNGAEWPRIYEANKQVVGNNPDLIFPGQVLHIPPTHTGPVPAYTGPGSGKGTAPYTTPAGTSPGAGTGTPPYTTPAGTSPGAGTGTTPYTTPGGTGTDTTETDKDKDKDHNIFETIEDAAKDVFKKLKGSD